CALPISGMFGHWVQTATLTVPWVDPQSGHVKIAATSRRSTGPTPASLHHGPARVPKLHLTSTHDSVLRPFEQGVLTASMDIRAVAFDVNGTLVRILTEDGMEQIFRSAAHFLTYQGIDLHRHQVRDLYFGIMEEQQRTSSEEHPEFDAVGIWRSIIEGHM